MSSLSPRALVFDWGDTLMVNFTQYDGPMADWPQVQAVDGIGTALQALHGSCALYVGTNAQASSADQVRAALGRVGLAQYLDGIFTYAELGARKPQPQFFHNLAAHIQVPAEHIAMVGDEWKNDVLGAHRAGWRSVWYNPTSRPAASLTPLQDADLTHLSDLPQALAAGLPPSVETCLGWLWEQPFSFNLLNHVQLVAAAAYQLALWLRARGETVSPVLTHRGGLLHDIAKLAARAQNLNHGELGGRILAEKGQPVLAEIVRRHTMFTLLDPQFIPTTWEEKLVYFADKLVEGGQITPLSERIAALKQRYQIDPQHLDHLQGPLQALQEEICAAAGFPTDQLIPRLREAFNAPSA
mgnify:FL=1